jgi:hypothetical protein
MRFDYTVALTTAIDESGWYGVQPQGHGGPNAGLGYDDMQATFGFTSRPLDADIDADGIPTGCFLWRADVGNSGGKAWLGTDPRAVAKCPPVTRGSAAQWNAKGAFLLLDYEADTFTAYVPVEFSGGAATKASTLIVGKDANGSVYNEMRHANGAYFTQTETSTVIRHTSNALIEILTDAIKLNGKVNATASMNVGGALAQPVVNATLLAAVLNSLAVPLNEAGTAPIVSSALGGLLQAIASALTTTAGTQMLKGL